MSVMISEYLAQCDARYAPRVRDMRDDDPVELEGPPPEIKEILRNDPAPVLP